MTPRAHVAHELPGRVRLRVPSRRKDEGFFQRLVEALEGVEGVTRVQANPVTGGVLVIHDGTTDALAERIREAELLRIVPSPAPPARPRPIRTVGAALDRLDRRIREGTGGQADLDTAAFLFLAGGALVQAVRGSLLPSAVSLARYALSHVERGDPAGPTTPGAAAEEGDAPDGDGSDGG